ncbi:MAG: CCA tRNA nucleotidyltransferase [Acidobacteriaceae bacterium]
MADYIYLLENRLSEAQKLALFKVREIARAKGLTVFLVGGAVRDLTSGSPVRDLDVAVQGNALKLKKDLLKEGAILDGELEAWQTLFVRFPGNVRMEVGSTLTVHYPKPGKPVVKAATILDDLRRRDFTANAMALSLNEGSYGLLMDPLNGVADIENRELRLANNYGFIEEPVRMVRAVRFAARLGWQLEEKTQARYETGKAEGYISALQNFHRGYEAEEIVHEEDPLRVMRGLEQEGWLKRLVPGWGSAKANVVELEKLREAQMQLQMQGIVADASAAQFPLLTAKMAAKDAKTLKKSFPRKGFVAEIDALEGEAKRFAAELGSKQVAKPSQAWKLLMAARPEVVLWVAYSTKNAALQAKFQSFYTEWPQARQRIPYAQMQEMRIVPELAGYDELVEKLFFELMDGHLGTEEEMKAYLEPYSPPAPPPTVHPRRARASKKDAKASKTRKKAEADEGLAGNAEGLEEAGLLVDVAAAVNQPTDAPAEVKTAKTAPAKIEAAKTEAAKTAGTKPVEKKAATATKAVVAVKPVAAAKADKKAAPAKKIAVKKVAPVQKVAAKKIAVKKVAAKKAAAKVTGKVVAKKVVAKAAVKKAAAKKSPAKAAGKKVAAKKSPAKAAGKSGSKVAVKAGTKPGAKSAGKAAGKASTKSAAKGASKKKR